MDVPFWRDHSGELRTLAYFTWNIEVPVGAMMSYDAAPSFVPDEVGKFTQALQDAGLRASPPAEGKFVWNIICQLPHIRMDCEVSWSEEQAWSLICTPRYGWINSILLRSWKDEQEQFLRTVDAVLRSDPRTSNVRWYSWDESETLEWLPHPFRCPTCGSESIQIKAWGHGERLDKPAGWYWYATCQACHKLCAAWYGGQSYVPTVEEWATWVAMPRKVNGEI